MNGKGRSQTAFSVRWNTHRKNLARMHLSLAITTHVILFFFPLPNCMLDFSCALLSFYAREFANMLSMFAWKHSKFIHRQENHKNISKENNRKKNERTAWCTYVDTCSTCTDVICSFYFVRIFFFRIHTCEMCILCSFSLRLSENRLFQIMH